MQKRHQVPSSCRLDEAILKIKDPAILCIRQNGAWAILGTDSVQSIWNHSRILNETKVQHSKFRCAINAFKSKCIYSHGVSEISFTVFAPIRPIWNPLKPVAKIPSILIDPPLGSHFLSLPLFGYPFRRLFCMPTQDSPQLLIFVIPCYAVAFLEAKKRG